MSWEVVVVFESFVRFMSHCNIVIKDTWTASSQFASSYESYDITLQKPAKELFVFEFYTFLPSPRNKVPKHYPQITPFADSTLS